MRIIAGRFRRRKLHTSPGQTTRPFTDRAKESLFENMERRIIGKRIADVFAGTGTMGLESLSRGAACCTFIEKDKIALELLRTNVAMLECAEECLIWPADAYRCSYRPKGGAAEKFSPFEVIFFDPPYRIAPELQPGSPLWLSLVRLAREDVSSPGATLVLRIPEHTDCELPPAWPIDWTLKMSGMVIQVCTKGNSPVPSVESPVPEEMSDEG